MNKAFPRARRANSVIQRYRIWSKSNDIPGEHIRYWRKSILENNSKVLQSWPVSILEARPIGKIGPARRGPRLGAARPARAASRRPERPRDGPRGLAMAHAASGGPAPSRWPEARRYIKPSSTYYEFDKDLRACLVNSSNKSSRSRFLGIFPTNNRWLLKETVTPIFFPFRIS